MPDERYDEYRTSSDYIRAHIFPGGHLPSLDAMVRACSGTGLALVGKRDIGLDYAVTLRHWREKLLAARGAVLALGYSETFWRKYVFYFAYCEAAFDVRYITNYMLDFQKGGSAHVAAGAANGHLQNGNGHLQNGNGNGHHHRANGHAHAD